MNKAAVLGLALLGGCAPYVPPSPPTPRMGTEVETSFTHSWDAVIDVFSELNIGIKTMDRASGLIVAEQNSVPSELVKPDVKVWADCGRFPPDPIMGEIRIYPNFVTYNVLVRGDSSRSTVKATARWEKRATGQYEVERPCVSLGAWEQGVEQQIKERALGKRR
jgi:hypothetical protein